MQQQSCSPEECQAMTEALLNGILNVPSRSNHATSAACIEEYVEWRARISGHALLFEMFFSSVEERDRFSRCLSMVLEINACVMVSMHAAIIQSKALTNLNFYLTGSIRL
jgi:hypothetical protein